MKQFKNLIALFVVLLAATGCKKDKQADAASGVDQVAGDASIQVVVDLVVKKNDDFQLFYSDDRSLEFTQQKSAWFSVIGKNESQQLVFNLPGEALITNLRFDVGQNPEQDEIIINSMVIKQHDKEMEISGEEFFMYFAPNVVHVKASPAKRSFKGIEVNGIYDPAFFGSSDLVQALAKFNE